MAKHIFFHTLLALALCLSGACNATFSDKDAAMSNLPYTAPTTSPHLDRLAVVSVGLSLDIYRQGQVWEELQKQDAAQPNSLHVGSILPTDPAKYPTLASDKDNAWVKRKTDTFELGVKRFPEAWPIPTITIVRSYNPQAARLRNTPEEVQVMLQGMANRQRQPAGLHWHRIHQLDNGIVTSDTPEDALETVFRTFEANPDMPALLVYVVEGLNMTVALSSKGTRLLGAGSGERKPGELVNAMTALIFARPERMEWLRFFAPYTKVNGVPLYPGFAGWERQPPVAFQPSPFIPQPWTRRGMEQWDALKVLAWVQRPVSVSLQHPDNGKRLKQQALTARLAEGWRQAIDAIQPPPARLFYDGGPHTTPLAELAPALHAANSPLDLLESKESYDLTQRLGDTGAASPFVGLALATMASYLNGDTSVVMPLRRQDRATYIIVVTPDKPGEKPATNPFDVDIAPAFSSSNEPSEPMRKLFEAEWLAGQHRPVAPAPPRAVEEESLVDLLSSLNPEKDWWNDL
ncbi:TPA: type VI lipase adapter Tla3 domain-containing protein [Pseudomonas aeruginosa]